MKPKTINIRVSERDWQKLRTKNPAELLRRYLGPEELYITIRPSKPSGTGVFR